MFFKKKNEEIEDINDDEMIELKDELDIYTNDIADEELSEKIESGFLKVRIMFELVGKPKEHIEETIKKYLEEIESKKEAIVITKKFAPAKELENGIFSTFCETEMLVENINVLANFCYTYMPASIEIDEPTNVNFSNLEFSGIFNDLLYRLHEVAMELKKSMGKQKFAEDNTVKLIYNLILLSLKNKDKNLDEIYEDARIDKKELEKFMENLVNMKLVEKREDKYHVNLAKKKEE